MFRSLSLTKWRQFGIVNIAFHERLTILTGANGSGKTTLLNVLANNFGWGLLHVRVPHSQKDDGRWRSDKHRGSEASAVGTLEYRHGDAFKSSIITDEGKNRSYKLDAKPPVQVHGIHIPSHRPPMVQQSVSKVQISSEPRIETLDVHHQRTEGFLTGKWDQDNQLFWNEVQDKNYPSTVIKNWMLTRAFAGQVLSISAENLKETTSESGDLDELEHFVTVLSHLFPESFGFVGIRISGSDVLLNTKSGHVNYDSLSGGLHAILDVGFQIFLAATEWRSFVVTFDEPENHLHPAMQAEILPRLLSAFPGAQFIVASHSPAVIGSIEDSSIVVLHKSGGDDVNYNTHLLDSFDKSGTTDDILRDVLGVPYVMPRWAAEKLQAILQKYEKQKLSGDMLRSFRAELDSANLGRYAPKGVLGLIEEGAE